MDKTFRIHPAIGIARAGNSAHSFYLSPERPGQLPIDCDADGVTTSEDGKEKVITSFRDDSGAIRRQGARFRVYQYAADGSATEVQLGAPIQVVREKSGQVYAGTLVTQLRLDARVAIVIDQRPGQLRAHRGHSGCQ